MTYYNRKNAGLVHLVALGSNLPSGNDDSRSVLEQAVGLIGARGGRVVARSAWYRTPAVPAGSGPDFVNGAIAVEASLSPRKFLSLLHECEASFGRTRRRRWAPRACDLDLIASGTTVLPDPDTWRAWAELPPERQETEAPDTLILPHPRLQDRAFVLVPLAEIAPDWRHPVLGRTVQDMLESLPDTVVREVRKL